MSAVVKPDAPELPAGIHPGVSMDAYGRMEGLRSSSLKDLRRSPLHYVYWLCHGRESAPMRLGTAAHCAVLEPDRFATEYVAWSRRSEETGNLCPRRGKFWDAFQIENKGKILSTEDEMNAAGDIAAAVHGDNLAMRYLCQGWAEVSMRAELTSESLARGPVKRLAKARPDWLHIDGSTHYLVGLKTARDVGLKFGYAAEAYGYPISWAWYHDIYRALTGVRPQLREIVVESAPPHDVVVYAVEEDVLDAGRAEYQELLRLLIDCEQRQHFPGFAEGQEQPVMLPSLMRGSDLSRLNLEWSDGEQS